MSLHDFIVNFKMTQPISTAQVIERILSYVPEDIRPGYSCPAEWYTFAHASFIYGSVAASLDTIADINGWRWYERDDGRIIFEIEEDKQWRRCLTLSN